MYGINPDMQNSIVGASLLGAEVVRPDLCAQRSRPIHRMIRMISYHSRTGQTHHGHWRVCKPRLPKRRHRILQTMRRQLKSIFRCRASASKDANLALQRVKIGKCNANLTIHVQNILQRTE